MIKKKFKEFIVLNYLTHKSNNLPRLEDINLGNYIILRKFYSYEIIYLTTGTTISIPGSLVDIFESLNTYCGNQILRQDPNKLSDPLEKFIYQFLLLIYSINNGKVDKILNIIVELCNLGTKELKNYCKKEFDIALEPIRFDSLDKNIII